MSMATHVPAWKRIGLKLKSAGDQDHHEAAPVVEVNGSHSQNTSNKRIRDEEQQSQASKRIKSSSDASHHFSTDQNVPSGNDRFINSIYKGRTVNASTKTPKKIVFHDSETPRQHETSLSRKKSVSFTPETKIEDGQSGQDFAKAWLSRGSRTPDADHGTDSTSAPDTPTKAVAAQDQSVAEAPATERSKTKKPKRVKGKASQAASVESNTRSACIAYLQQYANDRPHWKFNKSRQNELLRHIWDTALIPPVLNDAILEYIQGLQGAESRKRLFEGAVAILDKLVEKHRDEDIDINMGTPAARKVAYEQAMQKQLDLIARHGINEDEDRILTDLKLEQQQADRASTLLWKALWQYLHPNEPDPYATTTTKSEPTIAEVAIKPSTKKSRKSRTAAVDLSDSSSDSDSDSDTSASSTSGSDTDSDSNSNSSSDSSLGAD